MVIAPTSMGSEDTLFQRFGKAFPKGTLLFSEGDAGQEMYVVQAGRVEILRRVRDSEQQLAVLGPGEFLGEMSIISNRPRNASARVLEDAKLLVIDPKTFEGMIRSNAEIAVRMIKKLAERLSEADARIESLSIGDPDSRVIQRILQLAGKPAPGSGPVEVEFSPAEQARWVGVGESAVRALLARLENAGLVGWNGDRLTVFDPDRLAEALRYLELKWKFGGL